MAKPMLLHPATRSILISFTAYSVQADWWTSNIAVYEISANDHVLQTIVRSYPFKPNFFETAGEHKLFIVDAIRIFMTLSIVTAILITKIV
jgi:hypothetical protein